MPRRKTRYQIEQKHLLIGGGIALLVGALLGWYLYVQPPPESGMTDSELSRARSEIEQAASRIEELSEQVRKEVTGIRGKVSKSVGVLPPDSVALNLNKELAVFRGMEVRPSGMDSD